MKALLILTVISSCLLRFYAGEDSSQDIDKLIHRICTVAGDKLKIQTASRRDRQTIVNDMKDKLKKTSDILGLRSTAHIQLLLQGITILSVGKNYQKLCNIKVSGPERRTMYKEMQRIEETLAVSNQTLAFNNSDENNKTVNNFMKNSTDEDIADEAEIKGLINKMYNVMKNSVNKDSIAAEKQEVAEKLKHEFIEAFNRTYQNSKKLNKYISLVEKGMDIAVQKLVDEDLQNINVDETSLIAKEALSEVPQRNVPKSKQITNNPRKIQPHQPVFTLTPVPTTTPRMLGVTRERGCQDVLKETCDNLRELDSFRCDYDGTTLSMHQLCDGNVDCPDGSDERNCIQLVLRKIHTATQVMAKVEMSQSCFRSLAIDNSLISKQGDLLSNLLKSQVDFLKKYLQNDHKQSSANDSTKELPQNRKQYHESVKEVAYEVVILVRSFASSLTNSLCVSDEKLQTYINDLVAVDLDREFEEMAAQSRSKWLPSLCKCNLQYCRNMTDCDSRCKRFCYQSYSLQTFNCQSNKKGQNSVTLEHVCDGKLDCFDETDEKDCLTGKISSRFEASKLFGETITLIKSKALTSMFTTVRVEMVELQACVHSLEKHSIVHKLDIGLLKTVRDKCFAKLASIFEVLLEETDLLKFQQEEFYDFLLSVNEHIIAAMKHAHMGNERVAPSEECFCSGTKCTQPNCAERCIKTCAVKSVFTSYNCSTSGNETIPIDAVCNKKINCPNAEDELNCMSEVCRFHHLKVIQNYVDMLSESYHGSSVGNILDEWKDKLTAHLIVVEKLERVTPQVFKQTVVQMLDDLRLTYVSMETGRQNTDYKTLKKLSKLAQHIMEQIKQCDK